MEYIVAIASRGEEYITTVSAPNRSTAVVRAASQGALLAILPADGFSTDRDYCLTDETQELVYEYGVPLAEVARRIADAE